MASSSSSGYLDDKKVATANVIELQPGSSSTDDLSTTPEEWRPGFRAQFPWFGCATLILAICITTASVVVLIKSNHKAVSQWPQKVAPNVILSILNSAASICFALAVGQGIAIAWWRRALRGASIGDLHTTWSFGDSSLSLIKYIKNFNLAAVAAMAAKLAIVDGVLFQRSTGTYIAVGPVYSSQVTTYPSNYLPNLATLNVYGNDTQDLFYWFTDDVMYWQQSPNGHISYIDGFECEGVCTFNLTAPGYVATCSTEDIFVDYMAEIEAQVMGSENKTTNVTRYPNFETTFNVTLPTAAKNYTWIGVNTTSYVPLSLNTTNSTQRCPATLTKHSCELRQAMINYPIYVQFTEVTTKTMNSDISKTDVAFGFQNKTDGTLLSLENFDFQTGLFPGFYFENWIENATMTRPDKKNDTADGGIFRALADRYTSSGWVDFWSTTNPSTSPFNLTDAEQPYSHWILDNQGSLAGFMWWSKNNATNNEYTCPPHMEDPIQELVLSVNSLAFTTAQDYYNRPGFNTSWDTDSDAYIAFMAENSVQTDVNQATSESHYITRFPWMYGAIASTLCCVLLVLPAYWGFWELGRKVTLNPLEVANAFRAPVLAQVTANAKSGVADDVVKVAKNRRVMYAEDVENEPGRRYMIVPR